MRRFHSASIIGFLTIIGCGPIASASFAQSSRDLMNMFGAIMQSAMVQATQTEWRKLPPITLTCVDETLRQRGISVQFRSKRPTIKSTNADQATSFPASHGVKSSELSAPHEESTFLRTACCTPTKGAFTT